MIPTWVLWLVRTRHANAGRSANEWTRTADATVVFWDERRLDGKVAGVTARTPRRGRERSVGLAENVEPSQAIRREPRHVVRGAASATSLATKLPFNQG